MRLKRLKIHNYRSIKYLEMECLPIVVLIGPNNHGKSNVLKALEFGLSSVKPEREDLFAHCSDDDSEFWVEMTFHELTEQERNTFQRYVLPDDTVCFRKTARFGEENVEVVLNGYVDQPCEEWLYTENAGNYTSRDAINQTPLKDLVPSSGHLTRRNVEEAQQQYIDEHKNELKFQKMLESGPLLGQKNVAEGILPDFYLLPAVSDLSDEIKVKSSTTFGKLLNRVIGEMTKSDERFIKAQNLLKEVEKSINERDNDDHPLTVLEQSIQSEMGTLDAKLKIEMISPEMEKLFELGTNVKIDDGVETAAHRKGHGLQRMVILALVRAWAKILHLPSKEEDREALVPRKRSDSLIFAIEEPEIFLHPHAQRALAETLRQISKANRHQVFVCTHSTHFIDMDHYKEIVIINKNTPFEGSFARQCKQDLFTGEDANERKKRFHMAEWVNPDRAEMFFAKKVIFVEGETEKVIMPYLAEKMGKDVTEVTLIDCGAKHNLPLYITIANAFGIHYAVVHDEDPLPNPIPGDWDENKRIQRERTFKLNKQIQRLVNQDIGRVFMIPEDFERHCGISRNQSEKMGKALAALDHFSQSDFTSIPQILRDIIHWMASNGKTTE
jgi:putative ATP-dependent endonuclease of OLD family